MTQPFPTKEHPQPCVKGCETLIYLKKNANGKYLPYDSLTDEIHDCRSSIQKAENSALEKPKQEPHDREIRIQGIITKIQSLIQDLEALK